MYCTYLVLCLLFLRQSVGQQQCCESRTVGGSDDKSGLYVLQSTGSPSGSCPEGCLYQKQGSSAVYCFHNSPTHVTSCSAPAAPAPSSTASPSAAVILTSPPNVTVALLPSLTTGTTTENTGTTGTTTSTTTTTTTTTTQSVEEVWQINRTRFSPPTITQKGDWGADDFCDPGEYAIGFQLYVAGLCDRRCNRDDDKALMGVKLFCAAYHPHTAGDQTVLTEITSTVASPCDRRSNLPCEWLSTKQCSTPAFLTESRYLSEYFHDETVTEAGADFVDECPEGVVCRNITKSSSDPVGGMNLDMRCSDGVTLTGDGVTQAELPLVDGEQTSSWSTWTTCPEGYAICGIRSRVHQGETDLKSNLGQTEVLFHCCQLPFTYTG